jgi:hypothetical protein
VNRELEEDSKLAFVFSFSLILVECVCVWFTFLLRISLEGSEGFSFTLIWTLDSEESELKTDSETSDSAVEPEGADTVELESGAEDSEFVAFKFKFKILI